MTENLAACTRDGHWSVQLSTVLSYGLYSLRCCTALIKLPPIPGTAFVLPLITKTTVQHEQGMCS